MSEREEGLLGRIPVGVAVLGLGLVGLLFAGLRFGASGVVLGLAALTLVGVITAFWSSLRTLLGETRLSGADAYAIGAPRVEEEQKRAVLRALKDLEFERSVGKISDDDYKALVVEYRREAKRLLRMLDEASADQRARAERVVAQRFAELGLGPWESDEKEESARGGADEKVDAKRDADADPIAGAKEGEKAESDEAVESEREEHEDVVDGSTEEKEEKKEKEGDHA